MVGLDPIGAAEQLIRCPHKITVNEASSDFSDSPPICGEARCCGIHMSVHVLLRMYCLNTSFDA